MGFFKFIFSKTFLKQLLLAVIVTFILGFLLIKWLDSATQHGKTVNVPDLAKLQLDEADQKLKEYGLRYVVLDSANYNPDYPSYSVIEQTPTVGSKVKENRKIYLKLNPQGYPKIEMPDMYRHTRRQAEPMLLSMGFKIGNITYKSDLAKDAVLELWANGKQIKAGDKVMQTTTIDLVLGDGKGK